MAKMTRYKIALSPEEFDRLEEIRRARRCLRFEIVRDAMRWYFSQRKKVK